jgi:hypothetical protein
MITLSLSVHRMSRHARPSTSLRINSAGIQVLSRRLKQRLDSRFRGKDGKRRESFTEDKG